MASSSHNRAFQAYNSHNFKNHPSTNKSSTPSSSPGDGLVFGRIPYSSIKITSPTPLSSDVNNIVKPVPMAPKRRSSTTSLGQLIPPRKSLQMTALASQRQSLWISIAKNARVNNNSPSPHPLRQPQQTNLMRKKLLRILLVVSYLLSISLFAIALATFYGFFYTGSSMSHLPSSNTTLPTQVSLKSNNTRRSISII